MSHFYKPVKKGAKISSAWMDDVENALGDGNPAGAADYVIFKSGSTYYLRNNTDGTIDGSGTGATAVIQAGIDALTSGGTIYFHAGTYTGMTHLNIDVAGLYLIGSGIKSTKLQFSTGGTNMVKFGTSGGTARSGGGIRNMTLNNTAAYTNGVLTYNHGTRLVGIEIDNGSTLTCGVRIDGGNASGFSLYNYMVHSEVYSATTGIQTQNAGTVNIFGGTVSACTTGIQQVTGCYKSIFTHVNNCTTGIDLDANNAVFYAVIQESNTTDLLFNTSCQYAIVDFVQGGPPIVTDNSTAKTSRWRNLGMGDFRQPFEHHTASDTLTSEESGSVHTNLGAGGAIKLTLPQDATKGCSFEFVVMTPAVEFQIDAGAAGAIYINGAKSADNAHIWADDEGESVKLVADGNGDWVALFTQGTWTVV